MLIFCIYIYTRSYIIAIHAKFEVFSEMYDHLKIYITIINFNNRLDGKKKKKSRQYLEL